MRKVSKSGKSYNIGSESTIPEWAKGLPCCWCGEKVVKTRQSVSWYMDDLTDKPYAWHTECGVGPKRG